MAQVSKPAKDSLPLTKPSPLKPGARAFSDTLKKPSLKVKSDTTLVGDSIINITDTVDLQVSTDSLDAPVHYEASDSGILEIPEKKFYLYGKASTKYETFNLTAGVIEIDNAAGLARAYFTRDTAGKVIDRPKMVDGDMESEMDSLTYNMRTRKGLTKSTYTKQGEMFVHGDVIKKFSEDEYYALRTRFTTCNLDTPHFAFKAKKVKLVNKKWAYSGLVFPEFEGVPLPVGLPFGIFPLSHGRHSGLLAPRFSTTQSFGLGLEGLGYYKVLNDNFDATIRTNIYSYGGYSISFAPTYRVRYKYQGSLRLDFQNTKINFKGDPDYSNTKTFNVGWSHSMDSKKRPGTSFSANVNFGSTKYNQLVANNAMLNFTNNINSSIQYSKTSNDGKTNLSVTANHSQNNNTGQYNISLPTIAYTVNTLYPFQKEDRIGAAKWWEKLGIGYNGQLMNQFSFFDLERGDSIRKKSTLREILDTMQWGAQHNIPITLSLPSLGAIQLSPGVSYQERWYGQQMEKRWDDTNKRLDTIIRKGLYTARQMSFSLSAATALFGTLNFKNPKSNIKAIRHVIRPTFGLSYQPDMSKKAYYKTQTDTSGTVYSLSYYEGSVVGAFSQGTFGGLNFGLQNNLEMKVRDKKDTSAGATKKIKLIDNLSINSSYNLMADSFKLAPFSILISTTLFEKMNITGTTTLNPYQVNNKGREIDKYMWEGGKFALGRITSGSLSFGTSFQSKKKDQSKTDSLASAQNSQNFITPEERQQELDYIRNNPGEFADFDIPWSLNVAYSLSFSRTMKADYSGYTTTVNSSANLSGDFNISPKWKLGGSTFFDLNTMKIGTLTMFLSREMHCWQMSINITPVGIYRSFNISISPKSGILKDLKVNRTRQFYM